MTIAAQFLIKDAFERIGTSSETITYQQNQSAIRSINLMLSEWGNRNFNFWTLEQSMLPLIPGINSYPLPKDTLKIIQCELRRSQRNNYSGFAISSGHTGLHVPEFAFDNDPSTYYQSDDRHDRWVQYSFQNALNLLEINPTVVTLLGFNAYNPALVPWTLRLVASKDDFATEGAVLLTLPPTIFLDNQITWFVLNNIQQFTQYRIEQIDNDTPPMAFREIYFNNNILDTTMTEISQYDYVQYPQKQSIGVPTVYYVNYQINPQLFIWQTPSPQYNCLYYSAQKYPKSLTAVSEAIDIPMNFYSALVLGLSSQLAQKYAPDKADILMSLYEQAMEQAIIKNRVNLPITIGLYGTGQ